MEITENLDGFVLVKSTSAVLKGTGEFRGSKGG